MGTGSTHNGDSETAPRPRAALTGKAVLLGCVFALAICLTFSHVIRVGPAHIEGMFDVQRYFVPMASYVDQSIHRGTFPLWNPLTYCGTPVAANPQSSVFYPPNLLRACVNRQPTPDGTQTSVVIMWGMHLWLASIFAYLFARSHGISTGAALCAGFGYGLSALMVQRACTLQFVPTMTWIPLLFLAVKAMLDAGRVPTKLAYAGCAGLTFALAVLAGYLHVLPYVALSLVFYWLGYAVLRPGSLEQGELDGRRMWRWNGLCVVLLGCVAAGGAAAMLLPLAELIPLCARAEKGVALSGVLSDPIRVTVKKLLLYAARDHGPEGLRGNGAVFLVLCLLAVTHTNRRLVLLFGLMAFVLVDCMIGPPMPLSRLLSAVSPVHMLSPTRALDVALLPLCMLAALGADALRQPGRRFVRLVIVSCGTCAVTLVGYLYAKGLYIPVSPLVVVLPGAAVCLVLIAVCTGTRRDLSWLLAALLFFETLAWNHVYVPEVLEEKSLEKSGVPAEGIGLAAANVRGTDPLPMGALSWLFPAMNGYEPLHLATVRRTISGETPGRMYYRAVENWEPTADSQRGNLFLKRFFWLARQYCRGHLPPKEALYPSASTVFVPNDTPIMSVPRVEREEVVGSAVSSSFTTTEVADFDTSPVELRPDEKTEITFNFQVPTYAQCHASTESDGVVHSTLDISCRTSCPVRLLPSFREPGGDRFEYGKSYVLGAEAEAGGEKGEHLSIPLPDFRDVEARITLETSAVHGGLFRVAAAEVRSDLADEGYHVKTLDFGANRAEIEVTATDGPRLLLFADAFYPGWRARVDGREAEILLCNDAFKAIVIPEGVHVAEFAFEPTRVYVGVGVSLAMCLVVVLGVAFALCCGWRVRRRSPG